MIESSMKKFIHHSASSKKALQIAQMSSSLPVNVLISGDIGVGKKLLCKEITQNAESFDALELEQLIQQQKIDLQSYSIIVAYNIDKLLNKKQFFQNITSIRIIATSSLEYNDRQNNFPVKIELEPLSKRKNDLIELTKFYTEEANKIYLCDKTAKDIEVDISENGISLKKSIYKSILFNSMSKDEMMNALYNYFINELTKGTKSYKELLEIFEVPLIKASKNIYKSQVQMAKNLDINRITLRKKIDTYFESI